MPTFSIVRRRRRKARGRRRNSVTLPLHRGKRGRWVSDTKSAAKPKRKRKRAKAKKPVVRRRKARKTRVLAFPVAAPVRKRKAARRGKRKGKRKAGRRSNPFRSHRRRRRRARRHNPFRSVRRRRRRARRNPGIVVYRAHRRRRRHGYRRNPAGIVGTFKEIFSLNTLGDVVAGSVGLSASLWGPKLLGHYVHPALGRGFGGVATSVVTTGVVSWLTGMVSPRSSKAVLAGGLLGSFAGLLSAIHCGFRAKALPFESGLFACALSTVPNNSPSAIAQAANTPNPAIPGMSMLGLPMGMKPAGVAGYADRTNPAGTNAILSGEAAFRRSIGVSDYVPAPSGMRDYAEFPTSANSSSMDSSPESF